MKTASGKAPAAQTSLELGADYTLTTDELASLAGTSRRTVLRYAHAGLLPAIRLRTRGRPFFYTAEAVDLLVRLIDDVWQRRSVKISQSLREQWASGQKQPKPRTGIEEFCACGCGRLVYRAPCFRTGERVFYDAACNARFRVEHNLMSKKLIRGPDKSNCWTAHSRMVWGGRLSGREGATAGIEGGRAGGRPPKMTTDEAAEIWRLHKEGLKTREIAARVFGDKRFKDRVARCIRTVA